MRGKLFTIRGAPWRVVFVKRMPKGYGSCRGLCTLKNTNDAK